MRQVSRTRIRGRRESLLLVIGAEKMHGRDNRSESHVIPQIYHVITREEANSEVEIKPLKGHKN